MIKNIFKGLIWGIFVAGVLSSCQQAEKEIEADLSVLADTTGRTVTLYVVMPDGTGRENEVSLVQRNKVSAEIQPTGAALLHFSDSTGFIEPAIKGLELPEDWMPYKFIRFTLSNPNDFPVDVVFNVYGARNRMPYDLTLQAGESYDGEMCLIELPLTARNFSIYSPNALHIFAKAEASSFDLEVNRIALVQTDDTEPKAVVDDIGQRKHADWEGKLNGPEELINFMDEELAFLNAIQDNPRLDKYGGWLDGPKMDATGFFYVTQNKDGRWWFVTPEGNVFWSLGVTGVRTKHRFADVTIVKDREYLFDTIPPHDGEFVDAWEGDHFFSFYSWNIQRKYESPEDWMNMVIKRLQKWGMNTLGNWSEVSLINERKIPYTYGFRISERNDYLLRHKFPDVFDPRWQRHADSLMQKAVTMKDDPYLLGYFVDNEAHWGTPNLFDDDLKNTPLRKRWEEVLKEKYTTLDVVNKVWGTTYPSWDAIRNISIVGDEQEGAFYNDYIAFETLYADTYFSFVKETLKKHDPNHLYLGCRFSRQIKPKHIVSTAGKYMDVMSVNVYRLYPDQDDMQQWYNWGQRPMLIGEHHLPLESNRQFPPKYQAFSEEERIKYYPKYVHVWAEMPFSLGSHWYQFVDQHLTGRSMDGENQTVGLVDITDKPYDHMIKAIRIASEDMYKIHATSK
jgi:hypothetical protein